MGLVTARGAAKASRAFLLIMRTVLSAEGHQIRYSSSQVSSHICLRSSLAHRCLTTGRVCAAYAQHPIRLEKPHEIVSCTQFTFESSKMHVTTLKGPQEMDVQCSSSSGAVMLPQHYAPGSTSGGDPVLLGPLFPGQNLTCQAGGTTAYTLPCTHMIAAEVLGHTIVLLRHHRQLLNTACAHACMQGYLQPVDVKSAAPRYYSCVFSYVV